MSWKAGRPRMRTASCPTMYLPASTCSSEVLPAASSGRAGQKAFERGSRAGAGAGWGLEGAKSRNKYVTPAVQAPGQVDVQQTDQPAGAKGMKGQAGAGRAGTPPGTARPGRQGGRAPAPHTCTVCAGKQAAAAAGQLQAEVVDDGAAKGEGKVEGANNNRVLGLPCLHRRHGGQWGGAASGHLCCRLRGAGCRGAGAAGMRWEFDKRQCACRGLIGRLQFGSQAGSSNLASGTLGYFLQGIEQTTAGADGTSARSLLLCMEDSF